MSPDSLHDDPQDRDVALFENGAVWDLLHLYDLVEPLSSPSSRREFFKSLSADQFVSTAFMVNAISTGRDFEYSYGNTKPNTLVATPRQEDKERLMKATFEAAQKILNDTNLDDATALRRTGLTVAASLNYIHPFHDGNGRAGRLIHYMIEFGTDSGQQVFQEETSAIITKVNLPGQKRGTAPLFIDAPSTLQSALDAYIDVADQAQGLPMEGDIQVRANKKLELYHQMMTGEATLLVIDAVPAPQFNDTEFKKVPLKAGSMSYLELHERNYLASSGIPFLNERDPELPKEIPTSMIDQTPQPFTPEWRAARAAQAIDD